MTKIKEYPQEDIFYRGYIIQLKRIWSTTEGKYKYAAWVVPARVENLSIADYNSNAGESLLSAFNLVDSFLEQQEDQGLVVDTFVENKQVFSMKELRYSVGEEG